MALRGLGLNNCAKLGLVFFQFSFPHTELRLWLVVVSLGLFFDKESWWLFSQGVMFGKSNAEFQQTNLGQQQSFSEARQRMSDGLIVTSKGS